MVVEASLGLGGNEGDVINSFSLALHRLNREGRIKTKAISQVYRTPPWGEVGQADFLNMAVLVDTSYSPRELLTYCLEIEKECGRQRSARWGPRTLDIDVITYDQVVLTDTSLTLPHPRAQERAFVLAPLAQIAPELYLGTKPVKQLLEKLDLSLLQVDLAATYALETRAMLKLNGE